MRTVQGFTLGDTGLWTSPMGLKDVVVDCWCELNK